MSGSTLVSFKRLTDDKENIEKAIFVSSIIQSIDFHLSFSLLLPMIKYKTDFIDAQYCIYYGVSQIINIKCSSSIIDKAICIALIDR